jgi:hypothetical protein
MNTILKTAILLALISAAEATTTLQFSGGTCYGYSCGGFAEKRIDYVSLSREHEEIIVSVDGIVYTTGRGVAAYTKVASTGLLSLNETLYDFNNEKIWISVNVKYWETEITSGHNRGRLTSHYEIHDGTIVMGW